MSLADSVPWCWLCFSEQVGAAKLLVEAGSAVRDLPALLQLATSAGGPCGDLVAYLRSLEAPGGGGTDRYGSSNEGRTHNASGKHQSEPTVDMSSGATHWPVSLVCAACLPACLPVLPRPQPLLLQRPQPWTCSVLLLLGGWLRCARLWSRAGQTCGRPPSGRAPRPCMRQARGATHRSSGRQAPRCSCA